MAGHRKTLLIGALALSASACAPPARPIAVDLLKAFGDAELRSDELDLASLASDPFFERRGWSRLEGPPGRRLAWAQGKRSRLRLPFHSASDKELYLKVRSHESLGPQLPLSLQLNGAPLAQITLAPKEQEFRVVIPAGAQSRGDNLLEMTVPRQRVPEAGDADRRELVAAFSAITVRPIGAPARSGVPAVAGTRVVVPPASSLAYYVRVPPGARLTVGAEGGEGGTARLVGLVEDDTRSTRVLDRPLGAGGSIAEEVGLENRAGEIVRLELANPGPQGTVWLTSVRLTLPAPSAPPPPPARAQAPRPNIVLYLVDTLRADYLGAYGHAAPTSPRLDAFARDAVLFEDAWAQASWTRSAVASVLTGLHVQAHGVDREDRVLPPSARTLPEALRAAGYRTGAFVANHLLGGRFGFDQGFDAWNPTAETLYGAPASDLVRGALAWLDSGPRPFFLYVHTMEPHAPYTPSEEDLRPFAVGDYRGATDTRSLLRLGQLGTLDAQGLAFLRSRYEGEVHQNDRAFGELLDGLQARGLAASTVVVFTADHGEEFQEHGGTEHAKTLYQELVRVPLVVRLPGASTRGARERSTVQQIDLMPTMLGLAGVAVPPTLPGRDLGALFAGRPDPRLAPPVLFSEERFAVVDKLSARAGNLKLIFNNDGPALWRAGSHLELYDLARDSAEKVNLAASRPIAVAFLQRRLDAFREAAPRAGADQSVALSSQEKEQLRALGYAQ
jgi:arylsulfatase A-like enzyme